jgi:hypothetical protein
VFSPTKLKNSIQVYPQGLALTGEDMTSFVLFKDKKGRVSFPIWCPMLPLGFIQVDQDYSLKNPFDLTFEILTQLKYKVLNCVFDKIESDEQMATLFLSSQSDVLEIVHQIHVKAHEALALCGSKNKIDFFATEDFINKTRDVAVFEKSKPTEVLKKNSFLKSRQKYLM